MSSPELQPDIPPDQRVQEIPEAPEIPEQVQSMGVSPQPAQPAPVVNNGQVVVQANPTPSVQSGNPVIIPATNEEQIIEKTKDKVENSRKWRGVFLIFKIKKALKNGVSVIFGGGS